MCLDKFAVKTNGESLGKIKDIAVIDEYNILYIAKKGIMFREAFIINPKDVMGQEDKVLVSETRKADKKFYEGVKHLYTDLKGKQ